MRIAPDPARGAAGWSAVAVAETRIRLSGGGRFCAGSARKRPVAILAQKGDLRLAFALDGSALSLDAVEDRCPGALAALQRPGDR